MTFKKENYGFLASRVKVKLKMYQLQQRILPNKKEKASYVEITKNNLGFDLEACPCCKTGRMKIVLQFGANAPPKQLNDKRKHLTNKIL